MSVSFRAKRVDTGEIDGGTDELIYVLTRTLYHSPPFAHV
jgi:hypothetical protein